MRAFIFFLLLIPTSGRDYRVIKTDEDYTFEVSKRFARAYYDKTKHQLTIKAPGFRRTWNLPDDAMGEKARTFLERVGLQVVVPRRKMPKLLGGEVPRGTTIRFKASNVCLTTDGSDPVCGTFKGCFNGHQVNEFTVEEEYTVVKVRSCNFLNLMTQAVYEAYDDDIWVEDVPTEPQEDTNLKGRGWFDRHGKEREY